MIRIYFNYKPLMLCSELTPQIDEYLHQGTTLFLDELNPSAVKTMIAKIQRPEISAGVFLHPNLDELLRAFKQQFTVVQAAGGLVYTPDEHVLLIFRRGKWDLPKGKLDEGEDLPTCALREVEEETGLTDIALKHPLAITYHTYHENNAFILKENHWYLMYSARRQPLVPQTNEDIEKCEWIAVKNLAPYMENTLPSILEVTKKGLAILQESREV